MEKNKYLEKYDYKGPYINGIAEYRIGGEVGFINKNSEKVDRFGNSLSDN